MDNSFVEVYVMGGRVALTAPVAAGTPASNGNDHFSAGMSLLARFEGQDPSHAPLINASAVHAWHLNPIWTSTDDVLGARARVPQ